MIDAPAAPAALPHFAVSLRPPDLSRWRDGNTGIPGFTSFVANRPGPHVLLLAITHGNEIAGAHALDALLAAGVRPECGRLTFGFVNLAAFDRFDAEQPTCSRFVDEDLNRLWDLDVLEGLRRSLELDRAREIRPVIDSADLVLDLHSMLWPSDPLILCGPTAHGRALALGVGVPPLVVADSGHVGGRRIIDYARFTQGDGQASAILVEAGQHWIKPTVHIMLATTTRLLRQSGVLAEHPALPTPVDPPAPRLAEVTHAVTANTGGFVFLQPWRGGDVVPERNTLLALDGSTEIRSPYDDCLLVMPSPRASRGHTAVRLARFVTA